MWSRVEFLEDNHATWWTYLVVQHTRMLWVVTGLGAFYFNLQYLLVPFISLLIQAYEYSTPLSNAGVAMSAIAITVFVCRRLAFDLPQIAGYWAYGRWAGHPPPVSLRCPTGHHSIALETREALFHNPRTTREFAVGGVVMVALMAVLTMAVPAFLWTYVSWLALLWALLWGGGLAARTAQRLLTALVHLSIEAAVVLMVILGGLLGLLHQVFGSSLSGLWLLFVLSFGAMMQCMGGRSVFLEW